MAQLLDTVFAGFDLGILEAIHNFAAATGYFSTPFWHFISFFAHDGICMILLGLALCVFKRTRRTGVAVLGAIVIGALITNVTLKPLVMRARPYTHALLAEWWQAVGAPMESDFSFPSGHTTATAAAMLALFFSTKKKYSWPALAFILLMGFSRMYLMVHYPTDVLAGLLAGGTGACISALLLTPLLYRYLEKNREKWLPRLFLTFDPVTALRRLFSKDDGEKNA